MKKIETIFLSSARPSLCLSRVMWAQRAHGWLHANRVTRGPRGRTHGSLFAPSRGPWFTPPPNPSVSLDTESHLLTCVLLGVRVSGLPCCLAALFSLGEVTARFWSLVAPSLQVTWSPSAFLLHSWAPLCSAGGGSQRWVGLCGQQPCSGFGPCPGWRGGRSVSPDLQVNLCPVGSACLCHH